MTFFFFFLIFNKINTDIRQKTNIFVIMFTVFFISTLPGGASGSVTARIFIHSPGFMLIDPGVSCVVPTLYSFVGAKSKTPVSIAKASDIKEETGG